MIYFLLSEWQNMCEIFCKNHQNSTLDQYKYATIYWEGIVSTKYLNSTLIKEFLRISCQMNDENKSDVCTQICKNPLLTMNMVLEFPELRWQCNYYSCLYMNIMDILNHSEYSWDWDYVSCNGSVTMDVILANMDKPWNWWYLSRHSSVKMSDIESHLQLPWVWGTQGVSCNPNLTIAMIESHPDMNWDWYDISKQILLTPSILKLHAKKPWDFDSICWFNSSITLELLLATPDLPWNYRTMSHNDYLTIDIILNFPHKDWDWNAVSRSRGISISDVEACAHLPWNWKCLCYNRNIRMCDMEKVLSKLWSWDKYIHVNLFNPDSYIEQHIVKYSVLGMHDEDYNRGEQCLDYENVVDLVIQNEFWISCILDYM